MFNKFWKTLLKTWKISFNVQKLFIIFFNSVNRTLNWPIMHWAQTDFRLEKCSQTQPRSSSSSAGPLSLFSHFHQPPHRCFPLITAAPESGESVSSSCRSVPSLAGMELGRAEQPGVNQLIGHPRVLCMKDSNYKWGVRKFNSWMWCYNFCNPIFMKFICTLC